MRSSVVGFYHFLKTKNAALGMEIKNKISHRAQAIRKLAEHLRGRR